MRVTTKLGTIATGTIVTIAVLIPIVFWSFSDFNDAKNDEVLADSIKNNFFERSTFRDQYFLRREDRLVDEWDKSKRIADNLLRQADGLVHSNVDRDNLEQLRNSIADTSVIFHRIVSNHKLLDNKIGNHDIYEELDKRLSSQLLLKAGYVRDSAIALQDSSQRRVEQAYLRLSFSIGLFAAVLAISVILTSINLIRIVNKRLVPLHVGAKMVVNGDLAYQIPSEGSDEFAELAHSFNTMSAKLNDEISAHLQIENKLKINEAQLANAQSLAKIGNWHVIFGIDESHDIWTVSKELRRMWGLSANDGITSQNGFAKIHPEDRLFTQRLWESAKRGQGPAEWELRIIVGGNISWIHVIAKFIFDSHGNPLEASGTNQDVTERKYYERNLLREIEKSNALLRNASDGIHILNMEGNVIEVSDSFCRMLGYQREEMIGMNVSQWDDMFEKSEMPKIIRQHYEQQKREQFDTCHRRKDGTVVEVEVSGLPLLLENEPVMFYSSRDITERKAMEEQVKHMAQYDVLTDLPNRSLFSDRLQQALAIAKRDKARLALMYIDLDQFKPVNDEFGHHMGDLLLKEAANRMLECVRESDTIARLGGDEFVVLLPIIEAEQDAILVAEKIRHALNRPFELLGKRLNISSSTGIVVYPEHGMNEAELTKNADRAMYHVKTGGRNAVILFNNHMTV